MTDHEGVIVTQPGDTNEVDETGYVWAFLSEAREPEPVRPGALIVAGDAVEPSWPVSSTSSMVRTARPSCTSTWSATPRRPSTSCGTGAALVQKSGWSWSSGFIWVGVGAALEAGDAAGAGAARRRGLPLGLLVSALPLVAIFAMVEKWRA